MLCCVVAVAVGLVAYLCISLFMAGVAPVLVDALVTAGFFAPVLVDALVTAGFFCACAR